MAAPSMLLRALPLLRLRLHFQFHHRRCAVGFITAPSRRSWCTVTADSTRPDEKLSPKFPRWDDPDYRRWKDKEEEILSDIDSILSLAKDILHSDRYLDGEQLTVEDEKVVLEKLLAYHPHFEDKIGCGLDSIMVDRHPQFRQSRCLFVIRTDGVWIDFSYQKCLRAYIRDRYPSHAERFIREHFKRSSG